MRKKPAAQCVRINGERIKREDETGECVSSINFRIITTNEDCKLFQEWNAEKMKQNLYKQITKCYSER